MSTISRRAFIAAAGAVSAGAGALRGNPLGLPVGSQTWPHRQRIRDGEFAGLCKDMAALGVGELEMCSPGYGEFARLTDGKEVRRIVEDRGLKAPSGHFTLREMRAAQEQAIAWAKDVGMTQMGVATLSGPMQNGTATMDAVKRAADEYNKIGETASRAGIQQFLHDENFEMAKVEGDGRLVYQVLLELLDPKLVKMQFQMSAMPVVGDVVGYFEKYPGRFISLHLQGVPAPQPAGGGRPPQLAVGKDSVDWGRVFASAKAGGVKNYFVEQSWDLTVQSVDFLKGLHA